MEYKKSVLLKSFNDYYSKLSNQIDKIKNNLYSHLDEEAKISLAFEIQSDLIFFIKQEDAKIAQEYGYLASLEFQEVIYVIAALSDEMFLSFDWFGKSFWRNSLIEQKLFKTNYAGTKLVDKIVNFTTGMNHNKEIAQIYLNALNLGFIGKLRYSDQENIFLLKNKLYQIAFDENPSLKKGNEPLFKEAYESIVFDYSNLRKESIYNWKNIIIVSFSSYLIINSFLWLGSTYETSKILNLYKENKNVL